MLRFLMLAIPTSQIVLTETWTKVVQVRVMRVVTRVVKVMRVMLRVMRVMRVVKARVTKIKHLLVGSECRPAAHQVASHTVNKVLV